MRGASFAKTSGMPSCFFGAKTSAVEENAIFDDKKPRNSPPLASRFSYYEPFYKFENDFKS
jgi:hypothetical protein